MTGLIERFLNPSFLLALLLAAALVLILPSATRRLGRQLLVLTAFLLLLISLLPTGTLLLAPLEERFPATALPGEIAGIVAIGGAEQPGLTAIHGQAALNDNSERLLGLVRLMRQYPDATVVFAGGRRKASGLAEADVARMVLLDVGADTDRVRFFTGEFSTAGNAKALAERFPPEAGRPWVLVTSAWHMPRAVGVFRKAGFEVAPYPVDFRTAGTVGFVPRFNLLGGLAGLQQGMREWMALVVYRLLGRTDELLPAPRPADR